MIVPLLLLITQLTNVAAQQLQAPGIIETSTSTNIQIESPSGTPTPWSLIPQELPSHSIFKGPSPVFPA